MILYEVSVTRKEPSGSRTFTTEYKYEDVYEALSLNSELIEKSNIDESLYMVRILEIHTLKTWKRP